MTDSNNYEEEIVDNLYHIIELTSSLVDFNMFFENNHDTTNAGIDDNIFEKALSNIKYLDERSNRQTECSICLENGESDTCFGELEQCSHIFHMTCILQWLNKNNVTCPICRTSII